MLQRALPLTVLQYRRDRLLVQRVRELLRAGGGPAHTADTLAAALHMSTRSLHRQLRDEGAALQPLKDEVRRELAVERLQRTDRGGRIFAFANREMRSLIEAACKRLQLLVSNTNEHIAPVILTGKRPHR